MDKYIKSSIIHNFDLEGLEPLISTVFDACNSRNLIFNIAQTDIENSFKLTKKEKRHFNKYLNYLKNSNYPLDKYLSIHIIASNINGPKHFVQIKNVFKQNINNDDVIVLNKNNVKKEYSLYINYKPEIFKEFNKSEYTNLLTKRLFNCSTVLNCIVCVALYNSYKNPNIIDKFIKHPYLNSCNIIFYGVLYSIIGVKISNLYSNYSNIIFNGVLGYVNCRLFNKIFN